MLMLPSHSVLKAQNVPRISNVSRRAYRCMNALSALSPRSRLFDRPFDYSLIKERVDPAILEVDENLRKYLISSLLHKNYAWKISKNLQFFKTYVSSHFKLKDEIALLCVYPNSNLKLEHKVEGKAIQTSMESVEVLGRSLMKLEISLCLANLSMSASSTDSGINPEIFERDIGRQFLSRRVLGKYIESKNFKEHIILSQDKSKNGRLAASESSFFRTIGLLSLNFGKASTSKFIGESILNGSDGLVEQVFKK